MPDAGITQGYALPPIHLCNTVSEYSLLVLSGTSHAICPTQHKAVKWPMQHIVIHGIHQAESNQMALVDRFVGYSDTQGKVRNQGLDTMWVYFRWPEWTQY